jgi:uncharacterized protein YjiS (DUF1127 family)
MTMFEAPGPGDTGDGTPRVLVRAARAAALLVRFRAGRHRGLRDVGHLSDHLLRDIGLPRGHQHGASIRF